MSGATLSIAVAGEPQRAVYAGTGESRGIPCVQRSVDGGVAWERADRGIRRRDGWCGITTLTIDPRAPGRLVAAGFPGTMPFLTRLASNARIDYSTYLEEGGIAVVADIVGNA